MTGHELVALLASEGEDYWNSPDEGGFAGLTFCPEGWIKGRPQTAKLDFTMKTDVGFHFYYYVPPNRGLPTAYLFSSNGGPLRDTVEVNWAGGKRRIYTSLFVPLEMAQKVIERFCLDGKPAEAILWIPCGDVPHPEES
jgi:hypothetical protein